ncbi:MAG: hypothetical protein IKS10_09330 [Lachnospiraceae bacterium]|nr:hypothetical protein [Lachnospiraceae bacterium]
MVSITVYPYASEYNSLFRRLAQEKEGLTTYNLVSPANWNIDAAVENTIFSTDYEDAIKKSEELIVIDSPKAHYLYVDIVNKIERALEMHKKVFCAIKLKDEDIQRLLTKSLEDNGFVYLFGTDREYDLKLEKNTLMSRQNCIVVAVAGMIRGMNLSEACIDLAGEYEKHGYKVAIVSGYANCELLSNHYLIPDNIFSNDLSEYEKVLAFNKFIAEVERMSRAEILIVCIIDGIMSYSDVHYGDFGLTAIEQTAALNIDYFVLSVLPEFLGADTKKVMQELNMMCRYRLGSEIDAVVIERCEVDEYELETKENYAFLAIDPSKSSTLLSELRKLDDGVKYYEGGGRSTYASIVEECIEQLSDEVDVF